jgi:hypothetical protein
VALLHHHPLRPLFESLIQACRPQVIMLKSDFDTCFRHLFSNQPLMGRQKVVGTTNTRFGQFSPIYGSDHWAGEAGGG